MALANKDKAKFAKNRNVDFLRPFDDRMTILYYFCFVSSICKFYFNQTEGPINTTQYRLSQTVS